MGKSEAVIRAALGILCLVVAEFSLSLAFLCPETTYETIVTWMIGATCLFVAYVMLRGLVRGWEGGKMASLGEGFLRAVGGVVSLLVAAYFFSILSMSVLLTLATLTPTLVGGSLLLLPLLFPYAPYGGIFSPLPCVMWFGVSVIWEIIIGVCLFWAYVLLRSLGRGREGDNTKLVASLIILTLTMSVIIGLCFVFHISYTPPYAPTP